MLGLKLKENYMCWYCKLYLWFQRIGLTILAPPSPTSLDGILGGCVTTRQTQIAVHGVLCLVQVWFRLQLKFNSFVLDSEVGRLVMTLKSSRGSSRIKCKSSSVSLFDIIFMLILLGTNKFILHRPGGAPKTQTGTNYESDWLEQ